MKYVYLDNKHQEFLVDPETYEQVFALVQAGKLCTHDWKNSHSYTLDNPCVGKNICLRHLLINQPNLTVLDSPATTSDGRHCYRFADSQGYVYTTIEDVSDQASKNTGETFSYYGFTPPLKIESRGKSTDFYSYYATLYGDLRSSVMVLLYNHYSDKVKGIFLLYKNGPCKELSRKSDLYRRAEELVEACKDVHGQYHINGHVRANRFEADVYEVISQLESALYDVARKLQTKTPAEETHGEKPMRQDSDA